MSRVDYNHPELGLTFSFGVDHITSTFVNVQWEDYINDQTITSLVVDHNGWVVMLADEETVITNTPTESELETLRLVCPPALFDHLLQLDARFVLSKKAGNRFPNLHADDIIGIALAVGVSVNDTFKADVYRALD